MDLKDYLHLYFGCPAIVNYDGEDFRSKIESVDLMYPRLVKKLILRPLSDITEIKEQDFRWLLSKGFDLFGLIHAGLAIDAKEVENG